MRKARIFLAITAYTVLLKRIIRKAITELFSTLNDFFTGALFIKQKFRLAVSFAVVFISCLFPIARLGLSQGFLQRFLLI